MSERIEKTCKDCGLNYSVGGPLAIEASCYCAFCEWDHKDAKNKRTEGQFTRSKKPVPKRTPVKLAKAPKAAVVDIMGDITKKAIEAEIKRGESK